MFETFSSDHCPFRFDDEAGKMHPKARTSFRWVPNGIPGVAARLPILFSEGVAKGRITLNEFVALTSTNHAKLYGLYPRKGSIMIGADADIVLWDADKKVTLTQDLMQHGSDYTPYEGMEVTGWPVKTLLRGEVVVDEGRVGKPGQGQFLARETSRARDRARPGATKSKSGATKSKPGATKSRPATIKRDEIKIAFPVARDFKGCAFLMCQALSLVAQAPFTRWRRYPANREHRRARLSMSLRARRLAAFGPPPARAGGARPPHQRRRPPPPRAP